MTFDTVITSDWHANQEAAEAFQKWLADHPEIKRVIFLGDAVDYGPNPNETIDILEEINPSILIPGNHDFAIMAAAEGKTDDDIHGMRKEYKESVLPVTTEMMFTDDPVNFLSGKKLRQLAVNNPAEWPRDMTETLKRRFRERSNPKLSWGQWFASLVPGLGAKYVAKAKLEESLRDHDAFTESELLTILEEFQGDVPESSKVVSEFKKKYQGAKRRYDFLKRLTESDKYVIDGNKHLFHCSWNEKKAGYGVYVMTEEQLAKFPGKHKPKHYTFEDALANAKKVGRIGITAYVGAHLHIANIQKQKDGNIEFILVNDGSFMPRDDDVEHATFALTDGENFQIEKIPYDFKTTYEKMRALYNWDDIPNKRRESHYAFMKPLAVKHNDWVRKEAA